MLISVFVVSVLVAVGVKLQARSSASAQPTPVKEECRNCHQEIVDIFVRQAHAGLACSQCHAGALEHQDADDLAKVLPVVDFRVEVCSSCHRFQYETYFMSEPGTAGLYGGTPADPKEHPNTKDFPLYNKIIAGHAFTKEYNEERSHRFMLRDHINIKRGKNISCLNCKSTPVA